MAITDFFTNLFKKPEKRDFISAMSAISRGASSGIAVDKNTALTFTAVWSAVRLLSESISILPINIYQREKNGDKFSLSRWEFYFYGLLSTCILTLAQLIQEMQMKLKYCPCIWYSSI